MTYIHCPDCDAVREMGIAACPECGRCANCGEKVGAGECKIASADFRAMKNSPSGLKLVTASRMKWSSRKRPSGKDEKNSNRLKRAGRILLLGICVLLGVFTAKMLLAESSELTQVVLGMPVACILVLIYWVGFHGMGRILLWIASCG